MILQSKVSEDGCGGGGVYHITHPTRTEKLYNADLAIYVYYDGSVEIGKNRNGKLGDANVETAAHYFSKILSHLKLKDTNLDMFKEGLTELLYEAITKTLKGNYHEGTICAEGARDGSNHNRGT